MVPPDGNRELFMCCGALVWTNWLLCWVDGWWRHHSWTSACGACIGRILLLRLVHKTVSFGRRRRRRRRWRDSWIAISVWLGSVALPRFHSASSRVCVIIAITRILCLTMMIMGSCLSCTTPVAVKQIHWLWEFYFDSKVNLWERVNSFAWLKSKGRRGGEGGSSKNTRCPKISLTRSLNCRFQKDYNIIATECQGREDMCFVLSGNSFLVYSTSGCNWISFLVWGARHLKNDLDPTSASSHN